MSGPEEHRRLLACFVVTLTPLHRPRRIVPVLCSMSGRLRHSFTGIRQRGLNSSDHENQSNRLVAALARASDNPGASFQERKDARSVRGNEQLC